MITKKNQIFDLCLALIITIGILNLKSDMIISVISFAWVDACLITKAIYKLTWNELFKKIDIELGFKKSEVNKE